MTCKGCIFNRNISGGGKTACHYCFDTGKLRNCTPDKCDKKSILKGKEKDAYIRKLRLVDADVIGMSVSEATSLLKF